MTVRKEWTLYLVGIAIISVIVNSMILSFLIDRYFIDYTSKNYELHIEQIIEYSKNSLSRSDVDLDKISMDLETHIVDPIARIKLYDASGNLLASAGKERMGWGKNGKGMMGENAEEVESYKILDRGKNFIGQLNISRHSSLRNSMGIKLFRDSLLKNTGLSIFVILFFALGIAIITSRKMSRDLETTARIAQNVNLGIEEDFKMSKTEEILLVQNTLKDLEWKLKLKQKSRKMLIDELIHQSRTPLTILKIHLEGMKDGVLEREDKEFSLCQEQVEVISHMIENITGMIEAEREVESLKIEEFDLSMLIKQIYHGLKIQFEKKHIRFEIEGQGKILIKTDKYKLSQVIYNLVTNSYKFTKEKGTVKISYTEEKDKFQIKISDTGIGISEGERENVFKAYYRESRVKNISGDGLGLYVAKENIEKLGADLYFESEVGVGTTFFISLKK